MGCTDAAVPGSSECEECGDGEERARGCWCASGHYRSTIGVLSEIYYRTIGPPLSCGCVKRCVVFDLLFRA